MAPAVSDLLEYDVAAVQRRTEQGVQYLIFERRGMPRIPDVALDVAVYLYPTVDDAKAGIDAGGTGFVLFVPFKTNSQIGVNCIVTNRHVQENAPVPRLNRRDGGPPDCIPLTPASWFPHNGPHDLAIAPIGIDQNVYKIAHVRAHECLTRDRMGEYMIGVGDEVFMIGRFIGHDGVVHNEPTARFGNISAPVRQMRNSQTGVDEESFAVEMKSKPGYSGSPVWVYCSPFNMMLVTKRDASHCSFNFLLGVNWGQILEKRPLLDKDGKAMVGPHITEASGMNGVVPAWRILEMLDQTEVAQALGHVEALHLASTRFSRVVIAPQSSSSAPQTTTPDNPEHRESFNSLLNVAAKKKPSAD